MAADTAPGVRVIRRRAWFALAFAATWLPSFDGIARCDGPRAPDAIAAVSERGDVTLASGRQTILADLRPFGDDDGAFAARLKAFEGRAVFVEERASAPDRWGRSMVDLRLATGEDLAALLLTEGLGLVEPGALGHLCRQELLALEASARARGRGGWARAQNRPFKAADTEALLARSGTYALVEGRVRSVGLRGSVAYLNFGRDWSRDFTAIVPRRIFEAMRARGLNEAAITARRVRIRGVIQNKRGPAVDVAAPDAVEILETRRLRP